MPEKSGPKKIIIAPSRNGFSARFEGNHSPEHAVQCKTVAEALLEFVQRNSQPLGFALELHHMPSRRRIVAALPGDMTPEIGDVYYYSPTAKSGEQWIQIASGPICFVDEPDFPYVFAYTLPQEEKRLMPCSAFEKGRWTKVDPPGEVQ